nr:retrovirus-related Pol polyprotein from transposon TNT 1-94 [Tanacetum cinerariifolium]
MLIDFQIDFYIQLKDSILQDGNPIKEILLKLNLLDNRILKDRGKDSDHFAFVTKMLNNVNARTKKPNVVPISTRKPKAHAYKSVATPHKKKVTLKSTTQKLKSYYRILYEKTSKAWKWWIEQQCPSRYKWVPKTKMQWIIQPIIFIVDSGCMKHMTGNLKLLCNSVEKYIGFITSKDSITIFSRLVNFVMRIWRLLSGNLHALLEIFRVTIYSPDVVIGLPKLKFIKDQLCSSCEVSKAKISSFKSKAVPNLKERLNLLHMDLCGPMRVASINGKKYILDRTYGRTYSADPIPRHVSPNSRGNCFVLIFPSVHPTTASSLETKHDNGNIDKSQSKAIPNEASSLGTTLGGGTSDKDGMKLNELMELCTNLQTKVLDLEKTKTTQALEITSLKGRVKKLEKKQSLGEDASKQRRKINDIDVDEDITLVNDQDDAEIFDVNDLHGEEVFVEKEVADKEVNNEVQKVIEEVVEDTNTAKLIVDVAHVSAVGEVNAASIAATKLQDKGKAIMIEEPVKPKKKDQVRLDEEVALKLQAEFAEEQRLIRKRAQKEQEANIAFIETWDDIQAKINDDYQLA